MGCYSPVSTVNCQPISVSAHSDSAGRLKFLLEVLARLFYAAVVHRHFFLAIIIWIAGISMGCEASYYGSVQSSQTVDACRRYLARYPMGQHVSEVREILEKRTFDRAKRADTPLGYWGYLRRYPKGQFVGASRQRLATLAMARASTVADYRLIVERYRGESEADKAKKKLASALANDVLKAGNSAELAAFMSTYPGHASGGKMKARLVALAFARLGEDPSEIQLFMREHPGSPWDGKARARLRKALLRQFRQAPSVARLDAFSGHFPGDPELQVLRELATLAELRQALLVLDLIELRRLQTQANTLVGEAPCDAASARCVLSKSAEEVVKILKWCTRESTRCDALRIMRQQTDVHADGLSISVLTQQIADPDLERAWQGMANLSLMDRDIAADILLELAGAPRLVSVWGGYRGLVGWLERKTPQYREAWLKERLERRSRRSMDGENLQQRALLQLLLKKDAEGLKAARLLLADPARATTAAYLLIEVAKVPVGSDAHRLVVAFRARLNWLKSAFPNPLDQDSRLVAELVERELWILGGLIHKASQKGKSTTNTKFRTLAQEARESLTLWQEKLARKFSPFVKANAKSFDSAVLLHRQRRHEAFALLSKAKSPIAPLLLRAVCFREKRRGSTIFEGCSKLTLQEF
jgi:hypothetical protein